MERVERFLVELCRRGRPGFVKFFPEPVLLIRLPEDEHAEFDAVTDTTGPGQAAVQELIERHADASDALASVAALRVKRLVAAAGPHFTVGRTLDNYVPLPAKSVSKVHATIELLGDRVEVRDAGSKNGTTVAGARLGAGEVMELAFGVTVRFGDVAAIYHSPDSFCDFLEQVFPWAKA